VVPEEHIVGDYDLESLRGVPGIWQTIKDRRKNRKTTTIATTTSPIPTTTTAANAPCECVPLSVLNDINAKIEEIQKSITELNTQLDDQEVQANAMSVAIDETNSLVRELSDVIVD
jgi:methyl-accepting chemotaxis protein